MSMGDCKNSWRIVKVHGLKEVDFFGGYPKDSEVLVSNYGVVQRDEFHLHGAVLVYSALYCIMQVWTITKYGRTVTTTKYIFSVEP